MTSIVKSCFNSISNTCNSVSHAFTKTPACYAEKNFIRMQRTAAAIAIITSNLCLTFAPVTGGATAPFAAPLILAGYSLLGLSLIQQAVGDAEGCSRGKLIRIFAGIHFLYPSPINVLLGSVLWLWAAAQNEKKHH